MPITPGNSVAPAVPVPGIDEMVSINKTLSVAGTAENLALVPAGKKGRKFSLVNVGPGLAYVQADGTATVSSVPIQPGGTWYDEGVEIATKLSFIGEPALTPTVYGVLWAGA